MQTYFWYDYETFGVVPIIDRISQFGGITTDKDLNIIDEYKIYCKPTYDCLPSPQACILTGITPQFCEKKGLIEYEFIKQIHNKFSVANTCIVGYNSIRFDDEFTRHTLYRNFIDPYGWAWKNNNTRWDIIDLVRMCYAFKKDSSLNWVYNENKAPVFKLDKLSLANNIEHSDAHDALSDVKATIAIAKIIKTKQPRLFDYAFSLRKKQTVKNQLRLFAPMFHTSSKYKSELSCTRLVTALAYHPKYKDRAIVFNLDQDPAILLDLPIEKLKQLLFTKKEDLEENTKRLEIKELIFNKSPMFVNNAFKFEPKIFEQLQINSDKCTQHLDFIKENKNKITKIVQELYSDEKTMSYSDVDQSLYSGFISDKDRFICNKIHNLSVDELKEFNPQFKDERLKKLFINFKARNYPDALSQKEQKEWTKLIKARIINGENSYISIDKYNKIIREMRKKYPDKLDLIKKIESYGKSLMKTIS